MTASKTINETVDDMSLDQQIERLARQQNSLWIELENLSFSFEDKKAGDSLWDRVQEIVGNTYVVEGINPATGDMINGMPSGSGPYVRAAGKNWR